MSFFFFKQKTAYDVRISDWSSDVCSSDLASVVDPETGKHVPIFVRRIGEEGWAIHTNGSSSFARALEIRLGLGKGEVRGMNEPTSHEIGRASCRERVCQYV